MDPSDDEDLGDLYDALDGLAEEPAEPLDQDAEGSPATPEQPSPPGSLFASAQGATAEQTPSRKRLYVAAGAAAVLVPIAVVAVVSWAGSDAPPSEEPEPAAMAEGSVPMSDADLAVEICEEALREEFALDARRVTGELVREADTDLSEGELRALVNDECHRAIQALGAPEPSVPEFDPWNPGEVGDLFALATGRTAADGDLDPFGWLTWLDCRNVRPSGFWDHALTCDLPVDGQLVAALYVDWLAAYDDVDLDSSQRLIVASLSRPSLLEAVSESACEAGIGAVYVADLMFAHDLVFLYEGHSSEIRYDGAKQIVDHVNRAAAVQGFDSTSEVEVLPC